MSSSTIAITAGLEAYRPERDASGASRSAYAPPAAKSHGTSTNLSMKSHLRTRRTRLSLFIAFLVCVALLGGGSRSDIQSLVLLRPLSILLAAYAAIVLGWEGIRRIGAPFWLLASVAMLIALQLVPLPPSIWHALPQYDVAGRIGAEIGLDGVWRPLALSPMRAWNALFALSVPFAAMLLYQAQDKADRDRALLMLLVVGVASSIYALMQITGRPEGPLYLYRVTNPGSAVGFFANRNHQAVFIGIMILVSAWYLRSCDPRSHKSSLRAFGAAGAILLFVPLVLLTGSRAGLLISALALVLGTLFVTYNNDKSSNQKNTPPKRATTSTTRCGRLIRRSTATECRAESLGVDRSGRASRRAGSRPPRIGTYMSAVSRRP